ncbi:MAG: HAD family hydrolase [Candidatus Dormibacteria bacterium]
MDTPVAICFDMGYTLLRHNPNGPAVIRGVLDEIGHQAEPAEVDAALALAVMHYQRAVRSGRDFEASMDEAVRFWTEYNTIVLHQLGVATELHQALAEQIYTTAWQPQSWEIYPEVHDTLATLKSRGVRMAVISNFVDTLHAVCDLHGLTGYFETIVCSVDVGMMKPDPRIFARTMRRLGVAPAQTWHVGDNYWADVLGARAAGMTPVLIDRDHLLPRADCLSIESLDGLLHVLDGEVAA